MDADVAIFRSSNGDNDEPEEERDLLSPRERALYEATGHLGPYTPDEYLSVVGTVAPSSPPEPEPPEGVVKAEARLEEARERFEAADGAWRDALAEAQRIQAKMNAKVRMNSAGRLIVPGGEKKARRLRRLHEATSRGGDLREEREAAGAALQHARARYTAVYQRWRWDLQLQRQQRQT